MYVYKYMYMYTLCMNRLVNYLPSPMPILYCAQLQSASLGLSVLKEVKIHIRRTHHGYACIDLIKSLCSTVTCTKINCNSAHIYIYIYYIYIYIHTYTHIHNNLPLHYTSITR